MNCAEFALLYLTQNELREIRMIRCPFGSLPGPEKVPLLVQIARNLRHSQLLSVNGAKFGSVREQFPLFVLQKTN